VSVTLNLKPEIEAGLLAQAQATGKTLEDYLQYLVEREVHTAGLGTAQDTGSGMVWEDGLLIYGAGTSLPAGFLDNAVRRSRDERSQHLLGLCD